MATVLPSMAHGDAELVVRYARLMLIEWKLTGLPLQSAAALQVLLPMLQSSMRRREVVATAMAQFHVVAQIEDLRLEAVASQVDVSEVLRDLALVDVDVLAIVPATARLHDVRARWPRESIALFDHRLLEYIAVLMPAPT